MDNLNLISNFAEFKELKNIVLLSMFFSSLNSAKS